MDKYYVSSTKAMCDGVFRGMAIAGPFDTREQANEYIVNGRASSYGCLQITTGPSDLGVMWERNREKWERGEFYG